MKSNNKIKKYLRIITFESFKSLKDCLVLFPVQLKVVAKSSVIAFLNIFHIILA